MQNKAHPKTIQRVLQGKIQEQSNKKEAIQINKKKRLEFAKQYINVNPDFWNNVIFSDESKFNIYQSGCKKHMVETEYRRLEIKSLKPTVKHGGGSVELHCCYWGWRVDFYR